jgi:predicted acetyltransferase
MLVSPTPAVHRSFIAALREFHEERRNEELDVDSLERAATFNKYLEALRDDERQDTPRPRGWVPGTTFWYVDGEEFLGTLQIRHYLTRHLRRVGGHIGYEVRPSARRQGHATRMLELSLPHAKRLGIDPALVTCDATNIASRKVIEANGGRPDTPIPPKLRYWIPTS